MAHELYDTREAARILALGRAAAEAYDLIAERERAAQELLGAVAATAKAAGYRVFSDERERREIVVSPVSDSISIALGSDRTGVFLSVQSLGQFVARIPSPEIEYDPTTKTWIGCASETAVQAAPGQLTPRRSAVAVVAERMVEAFNKYKP